MLPQIENMTAYAYFNLVIRESFITENTSLTCEGRGEGVEEGRSGQGRREE